MAKGSQRTLGGWESKHCRLCGHKVVLTSKRLPKEFLHLEFDHERGTRHMLRCPTEEEAALYGL